MTATALILRSLAIGTASGMRSTLGLAGPGLFSAHSAGSTAGTALRALAIGGELVVDMLPQTPSRLEPPGLVARFVSGAGGAFVLARRDGTAVAFPVLAGIAGAAIGSYGGAAWRRWAGAREPDWQGAVVEDGVGLTLAFAASASR